MNVFSYFAPSVSMLALLGLAWSPLTGSEHAPRVTMLSTSCMPLLQSADLVARPRDPWVFRSVLDKRARMITVALNEELWVAYDATTCSLYKAWKGGVHFDGAVYTTVHGPQPTSLGRPYTEGLPGDVWEAWINDAPIACTVAYKGYRFHDKRVTFQYDVKLADGRTVRVQETPEFVQPEHLFPPEQRQVWVLTDGQPGLLRSFWAETIPDDVKLTLALRTDHSTNKLGELLEREHEVEVVDEQGNAAKHSIAHMVLMAAKNTNNVILFFEPIVLPPPEPEANGDETEDEGKKEETPAPAKQEGAK